MRFVDPLAGKRLFLLVAVVALVATPVVSAQQPVTRPFTISGELTFLDIGGGSPYTLIDRGIASETGKFVNVGKYSLNLTTFALTGFGIYYAANGDQLFWKDDGDEMIRITGGTGRFVGATGQFTFAVLSQDHPPGPEGTTSWVMRYKGEGSITY